MKNVKSIAILTALLLATNVTLADDYMYNQQIEYYNNMITCTPNNFSLSPLGTYTIYGLKDNKCHVKESLGGVNLTCYLPHKIAIRYAQEGKKMLNASKNNGMSHSDYIDKINNDRNYCNLEF